MIAVTQAEELDRLDWHLRNWVAWHKRGGLRLWYSSRASGGMGQSGSSDFDAMCANSDNCYAMAMDTIIDDLPQREKFTIYNEWLCTVFRFEGDPVALYDAAMQKIERGLAARGMW